MNLPFTVERCPGRRTPDGWSPECATCARRSSGLAAYIAGAKVFWMEPPAVTPCPEKLEPKK